jgi:hypothetical protein
MLQVDNTMMGKTRTLISVVLFVAFSFSCEKEPNNPHTRARGAMIHNMPVWLQEGSGYASDWEDWQGESGLLLHEYVPESIMPDSFDGKFRLYLHYGVQDISIGFNDVDGTAYCLFFNWYDRFPRGTTNSFVSVPQANPDMAFSFDCYAKTNLSEEAGSFNESHVSILKDNRPGSKYACRYVQTIAGKEIINTELFPVNHFTFDKPEWLPSGVIDPNSGELIIYFSDNFISQQYCGVEMGISWDNHSTHNIFSAEGMTVRSCDDSQQIISFNLLDGQLGGFADYFTFKRTGDVGELLYYRIIGESPVLVKECKNLICKDTY